MTPEEKKRIRQELLAEARTNITDKRREQSRINGAKNAKSKGQPRPKKGEGK